VIVGGGRVGEAIANMGGNVDVSCLDHLFARAHMCTVKHSRRARCLLLWSFLFVLHQHYLVMKTPRQVTLMSPPPLSLQTVVRRGEKVPEKPPGTPIIVCTRNDDLASVVDATPEPQRKGEGSVCVCVCVCACVCVFLCVRVWYVCL